MQALFFGAMGTTPHLTIVGNRWSLWAHMEKKKTKRLVGSRLGVYANISAGTHARLLRHAPPTGLSASKYTGTALEFYLDLEDAHGGPLTEQFRKAILRRAADAAQKFKDMYK
jgi:hypothetical protein